MSEEDTAEEENIDTTEGEVKCVIRMKYRQTAKEVMMTVPEMK